MAAHAKSRRLIRSFLWSSMRSEGGNPSDMGLELRLTGTAILYTVPIRGSNTLRGTVLNSMLRCVADILLCFSLIRSGSGIPFTAHATSPTITMPRVKAITTGSIPSFLDVILNFAESDTTSTLATQDTWLSQLKDKPDGKLIMFGDDTWLKLFPETFARTDGTTSFFVSVSV